ncbi:MAG: helix-turn-helix domain-containing protein [Chloroflexi bacterium]|nr:helix-turn-helix domain-containing protein [Chloroflexota bacterium]
MIELGQLLQQTRIDQELSLADVEAEIRIRQKYLEALEQGDWDALPNRAVAKGFLRSYARFLKLEDDPQVQAVFASSTVTPEPISHPEEEDIHPTSYLPVEIALNGKSALRRWPGRNVLRFVLAFVPVLVLAFLLYRYALPVLLNRPSTATVVAVVDTPLPPVGTPPSTPVILVGATDTPLASPTTQLPPTYTPTPRPTATPTIEATATLTMTATPTQAPTFAPIKEITLTLKVNQRAWVRVVTDGVLQLQNNLDPGAEYTFTAQEWLQMRAGNAGGVSLILNGEPLEPLGEPGEVVDYVWSIDGDRIIRTTPTPEPTETPAPSETPAASSELTTTVNSS